ncbi:MAG TPA: chromate transporter [Flavitalea sp.]|nr:chromate transporter [Flavitalea sp.]
MSSGLTEENKAKRLREIAVSCLKLGTIGFGGIAGMVATIENEMVVKRKWIDHWLTRQQLMDSIAVGQITPGPILSSATFAGYLIGGTTGGVIATAGIFLPSFFISFFLHKLLSSARQSQKLRLFLDGLSAASISIIAVVGLHLFTSSVQQWRGSIILAVCLALTLLTRKINTIAIILIGSIGGLLLLKI